tara:strand:+ start:184 stop:297 length:114 start_codon:yes stop_codon:yes gene_type:complete
MTLSDSYALMVDHCPLQKKNAGLLWPSQVKISLGKLA